jgi:hypothetical protein
VNLGNEIQEYFLSWQGQVTGPHKLEELRHLLKTGKIHSLYKVQVGGQWVVLRDHLGVLEHNKKLSEARAAALVDHTPKASPLLPVPSVIPDADEESEEYRTHEANLLYDRPNQVPFPTGIAIASFVLSLLFFVPLLNIITCLLALIFGHMALSGREVRTQGKAAVLAWTGLWISYVEVSYLLLAIAVIGIAEVPFQLFFLQVHAQMLGTVVIALIGSGVLMLGVKLVSGTLIRFTDCFIGALVPSAVTNMGTFILQVSMADYDLSNGKTLFMFGLLHLILFISQVFFWARFIRISDEEELGLANAAITSLLYTFVFIFVTFGYSFLIYAMVS